MPRTQQRSQQTPNSSNILETNEIPQATVPVSANLSPKHLIGGPTFTCGDNLAVSQKAQRKPSRHFNLPDSSDVSTSLIPINKMQKLPKWSISPGTRKTDFLELFDNEVRVLSKLANLEGAMWKGNDMCLDKDDLICLLMQESQRLEAKRHLGSQASFHSSSGSSHDPTSVATDDGLEIITSLLFKLKGLNGSTNKVSDKPRTSALPPKAASTDYDNSIDSGLEERLTRGGYSRNVNDTLSEENCMPSINGDEDHGDDTLNDVDSCFRDNALVEEFMEDVRRFENADKMSSPKMSGGSNLTRSATEEGNELEEDARKTDEDQGHTINSPALPATRALKRNKMSLHLFGTSRLHEELKLGQYPIIQKTAKSDGPRTPRSLDQGPIRFPVQYKFWAPADSSLQKVFHNRMDRRIISICRQSRCIVQLQPPIRKNANGMDVQQISIQAPSLGALERCCSTLDDVFPKFNASKSLRGRASADTIAMEEEGYADYQGDVDILIGGCHRNSHYRLCQLDHGNTTCNSNINKSDQESENGLIEFLLSQLENNEISRE